MNLSAYQRNVLRQAGIDPDVAEAIANAERQPDPFMGAFDREPQWSDAEHELRKLDAQTEAAYLNERIARERAAHVAGLEAFHFHVTAALDAAHETRMFGWRKYDPPQDAAAAISYVFEANKKLHEDARQYRELSNGYRDDRDRLQRQLDRTLWRRFKRMFEFLKTPLPVPSALRGPPGPPGPPGATGAMGAPGVCKCQRDDGPMGQEWK